ncbi:hypothetical protein A1Q2_05501 [Trichosporon asahii var. asahii CBS 8904]|uniref:Uncharacterized protein n=1 Tax=Trichosporon asahii var. asahii (strain CBS 8904) TaxID=1220162 RepID=K1VU06_TRIAC|nr:hypothetical protein A1Q2_05501 [Trichosporon asahii var. asahii CBS 8904]
MPKRKATSADLSRVAPPSLSSLDAALDLLAHETFDRLQTLTSKFEAAAGVKLNDGVVKARWEEAVKRYWVMKSMDDLCCSVNGTGPGVTLEDSPGSDDAMRDDSASVSAAASTFESDGDEEQQWRKWAPKLNDVVLVELQKGGIWPGKRVFLQGRQSVPRGNHFFPVRIYNEEIEPTLTVKSRMIPFHLRSSAPLMASEALLGAYNHAANPGPFDIAAGNRESAAAYSRTHPGVNLDEETTERVQKQKESWKAFVNWLMDERRLEKLRTLCEERDKRLKEVANQSVIDLGGFNTLDGEERPCSPRKRQVTCSMPPFTYSSTSTRTVQKIESDVTERGGIFRVKSIASSSASSPYTGPSQSSPGSSPRVMSPMASYIRPALSIPYRSGSPRRADRRRNIAFSSAGESSPRRRSGTFTPPRGSPSNDEPAPFASPSPAPTLRSFGFKFGKQMTEEEDDQMNGRGLGPVTALEAVLEEREEEESWTVVAGRGRHKRSGSAPLNRPKEQPPEPSATASDDMNL